MRNFRRLATSLVALSLVIAFSSCEKQPVKSSTIDVTFGIADLTNGISKKDAQELGDPNDINVENYPACTDDVTAYVEVWIDGIMHKLEMTSLPDPLTESVQLDADAPNEVTSFTAFNTAGDPIYVSPNITSPEVTSGGLIGVPFNINTLAWDKEVVYVDVVCWHAYSHKSYTWNWFQIDYNQIKTICFFGDVCTKFYESFGADGYDLQADFTVELTYENSVGDMITTTATTVNGDGNWVNEDGPLCISYIDDLNKDENATYDLILHTPTGDILLADDVPVAEGTWSEEGKVDGFGGDDGIYLFNVGNCGVDEDGQFPSYLPLPKTVSFTLLADNGDFDGRYTASAIATGTSIQGLMPTTTFNTWCVDPSTSIYYNVSYDADVYSLLDIVAIPTTTRMNKIIAAKGKLHWIINHIEEIQLAKPTWDRIDFQKLIWYVVDNTTYGGYSTYAATIPEYDPKVGDYAMVIIDPYNDNGAVQAFGVRIDP